MIKARSKRVSLLLVLMMLATLFVGVGTASADTDNVAITVPSVGTTGTVSLGDVRVTETDASIGTIKDGDRITLNLPNGVDYVKACTTQDDLKNYVSSGSEDIDDIFELVSGTSKTLTIRVKDKGASKLATISANNDKHYFTFLFSIPNYSQVDLDSPDADIAVEIISNNTAISSGKVINATSASEGTIATVLDDSTISNSSGPQIIGTIRVAENQAGALDAGDQIKIVAPSDVEFKDLSFATDDDAHTYVTQVGDTTQNWINTSKDVVRDVTNKDGNKVDVDGSTIVPSSKQEDGYSQVTLTVLHPTKEVPGFVNVKLAVGIEDDDLTGPLVFTVKGDNVNTQKLTVGAVGDYDVTVAAKGDPETVKAGAVNQDIQDLTVKEDINDSLLENRDLTLTLPDYAHWYQLPSPKKEKGSSLFEDQTKTEDTQRHEVSFTVKDVADRSKTEYTFEDMKIFLDADAPAGDLTVTVGGDAIGDEHEVVLAKVVSPLSAEATPTDVKLGVAAQAAGDLTLTETEAGLWKASSKTISDDDWNVKEQADFTKLIPDGNTAGYLLVTLPTGVTFDSEPTVEVTTGDLKIKDGSVKLQDDDTALKIPIDKASTVASTLTISGIKLTVDRTVPEGAVNAKIAGTAVDQVADYTDDVAKVAIATAVTPAPVDVSYTSTFVIGASTYTINGQSVDAVAPSYIKNSRTYLAVRDVAHALGIPDSNVLWDQTNYTVTLIKGDKVVQMKIGSPVLTVNGATITMDVAPEITADRTFLPAAWLAQAFGYSATFDAATQTVTIK